MPLFILEEIAKNTAFILIFIFLITQHKWFYHLFSPLTSFSIKVYYNLIFISFALSGAWLSTELHGYSINNIHLGIILAGLLGGLKSSLVTSAGVSLTLFILNFTDPPFGIIAESIILAFFSGLFQSYYDVKKTETKKILIIISACILSQITTILIFSNFSKNTFVNILDLIIPISVNTAFGIYVSLKFIKNAFKGYENLEALHAHETLKIADKTLPYLRTGLNPETAKKTVKLIMDITDVEAVAITDKDKILAFEGLASDHHKSGEPVLTRATRNVLLKGVPYIINDKKGIGCPVKECPLVSAIVTPLKCKNEIVGTLKLYQSRQKKIDHSKVSLSIGLANLLGVQMELAEVSKLEQLTVHAELRALQAQINPHFLFNTLNTIASFYRTQPEEARQLLVKFAAFFRKTLQQHSNFITLKEELEYINDYLTFEKARFGDRLIVENDIDPDTININVPILTLQPIVENAIQHGISQKEEGGKIEIKTRNQKNSVDITILDTGLGIPPIELKKVLTPGYGKGSGVGLSNINERLKAIYGKEYQIKIFSVYKKGTEVHIQIPFDSLKSMVNYPQFSEKLKH